MRLSPRSLAGQMALLLALALFVAQAVNLALILRERAGSRVAQAIGPAAARIADALDREATGRPLRADRGRVRRFAANPIPAGLPARPDVADGLRRELAEAGLRAGRIVTAIKPVGRDGTLFPSPRWRPRPPPDATMLAIAVEQPGRGWLVLASPWATIDWPIVWRLVAQTLILYVIILFPVLWIARRIAQPLRALADEAQRFGPGDAGEPVTEQGPRETRALIAAFNALRLRVTAMLDEKDRMLGAIGHDLRTPLAALRVRIESVEDDQDRTRMAETIEEMSRTLDDILSLARLGRPSEPVTEVDLAALVDAVVEDFRDLGADVTLADAPRLTLRLRPVLMRRAVRNLIENAVKYAGAAQVSVGGDGAHARVIVADRGPGIPADRIVAVFDPFTRLETSRNRETGGIGLGLSLARAIVREADGEITLANREGGGLEATIALPRSRGALRQAQGER